MLFLLIFIGYKYTKTIKCINNNNKKRIHKIKLKNSLKIEYIYYKNRRIFKSIFRELCVALVVYNFCSVLACFFSINKQMTFSKNIKNKAK
jgi:hypothetical protein